MKWVRLRRLVILTSNCDDASTSSCCSKSTGPRKDLRCNVLIIIFCSETIYSWYQPISLKPMYQPGSICFWYGSLKKCKSNWNWKPKQINQWITDMEGANGYGMHRVGDLKRWMYETNIMTQLKYPFHKYPVRSNLNGILQAHIIIGSMYEVSWRQLENQYA